MSEPTSSPQFVFELREATGLRTVGVDGSYVNSLARGGFHVVFFTERSAHPSSFAFDVDGKGNFIGEPRFNRTSDIIHEIHTSLIFSKEELVEFKTRIDAVLKEAEEIHGSDNPS